jgi:hypothetical protein
MDNGELNLSPISPGDSPSIEWFGEDRGPGGEEYPSPKTSIEWFGEDRGPGVPGEDEEEEEEGLSSDKENNTSNQSQTARRRLDFDNVDDSGDDDDDEEERSAVLYPRVLFMTPAGIPSKNNDGDAGAYEEEEDAGAFQSPSRWFELPSLTTTDERERSAIFGSGGRFALPSVVRQHHQQQALRIATPPVMSPDEALVAGHVTHYPMTDKDVDNPGDRVFDKRYWEYVGHRIQRSIDAGLQVQDRISDDDALPVLAIHMCSTQVEERILSLGDKTGLRRPFRAFFGFRGSNTIMGNFRVNPESLMVPVNNRHWFDFSLTGNTEYNPTLIPQATGPLTRDDVEQCLFSIDVNPLPDTEFIALWRLKRTIGSDFGSSYPTNCKRGILVVLTQDTASDFNDPGRSMMLIKPIPKLFD